LALLFGIGTKALPLRDSRMRWSNLCSGLAVRRNGRSKRTCELTSSIVPRGTSFHRSVELEFPSIGFDRSRVTGCLCRDASHAGVAEGADQQDGPQRCARHGADDASGALPPGACEDVTQSETADAADPSQAAAVEGDRHRERPARYVAQLRS